MLKAGSPMGFRSILFDPRIVDIDVDQRPQPECFPDLNLDQVVAAMTAGRDEYRLQPFFYAPLTDVESVAYRHEALRELGEPAVLEAIRRFAGQMQAMRGHLAQVQKLHYELQKQRWFVDAVEAYGSAVDRLSKDLESAALRSRGFLDFREYLATYTGSDAFRAMVAETREMKADLSRIRYQLHIQGARIRVDRYEPVPDYSADVEQTFEKFKQGPVEGYTFTFPSYAELNHVEAAILDRVALLFPDIFGPLAAYGVRHRDYLDETIVRFDREVQFYVACLEHVEQFKPAGLAFCAPQVTATSKEIFGRDVFDLALAHKLVREDTAVVTNDFYLHDPERIIVVSGPNQGGKTTFARTFGQLHYLASLGCPVPGSEARLFLFDRLFVHFEREEDLGDLSGKLESDLRRIHDILDSATPESILIMNESFSSTTLDDSLFLNKEILRQIIERDILCVMVTFLDELASLGRTTVSMVSTVDPDDPVVRTFKVVRQPADGLAYAAVIARKYGLTYERLMERIAP